MPRERNDGWYDSEESTTAGMIEELRRIRRRTRVRPLPVIALATLITATIGYRVASKRPLVEAEVVLALTEGSLSPEHNGIGVDELRNYVSTVLLPDAGLAEVLKKRGMYRVRPGFGVDVAVSELREQMTIEIWKNWYDYSDLLQGDQHSARIGITVADIDGDTAYDLARDLAEVVTKTASTIHQQLADQLARALGAKRDAINDRLDKLSAERATKVQELLDARDAKRTGLARALELGIQTIDHQSHKLGDELTALTDSQVTDLASLASGSLDMSCQIVEERRPERNDRRLFGLGLAIAVIAFGSLIGSALVVGAFDSRVHDTDDVERLGLPLLGHVPGFPGDDVGSLQSRGAIRGRVPSFLRWRSHR